MVFVGCLPYQCPQAGDDSTVTADIRSLLREFPTAHGTNLTGNLDPRGSPGSMPACRPARGGKEPT